MTKQSIISNLKNISSYYLEKGQGILKFNSDDNVFIIVVKGGIIYCNCIRIDNTDLIDFINDGKIISILDYSVIEKIDLLKGGVSNVNNNTCI